MIPSKAGTREQCQAIRELLRLLDILNHNGRITRDILQDYRESGLKIIVRNQEQWYATEQHWKNARGIR